MSLLQNYLRKGAEKIKVLSSNVIIGLRSNTIFLPLKPDIDALEVLKGILADSIIDKNMRTHITNAAMTKARKDCIGKLNLLRKDADAICNGDYDRELETGFTPSKRTRSSRTSIAAAYILHANSTGVRGQLELVLREAVPGNTGFEVHYIVKNGEQEMDLIAGVFKVKNRLLKMLVTNLPSGKPMKIYLITLSTNGVRSTESNMKDAVAL